MPATDRPTAFDAAREHRRYQTKLDHAIGRYIDDPTDKTHHDVLVARLRRDHVLVALYEARGSTESHPRARAVCACSWAAELNGDDHDDAITKADGAHSGHVARAVEVAGLL